MTLRPAMVYRPDIQGLRALAIMLVVLAHGDVSIFAGGFVGVDVFFVLSGYLITGLLLNEYENSGRICLAGFYARRLKRLLPALVVMLCIVALITPGLLSMHETTEQATSLAYAATWTSNLYFAFSVIDYFAELRTHDLFLHTWSLGLEEQFYLIWPVLLLPVLARSIPATGSGKYRPLIGTLAVLFVSSLGLSWLLTNTHAMWAYYLMPSRIWQFALGAGVFSWLHGGNRALNDFPLRDPFLKWKGWLGIVGVGLIVGSAMLINNHMAYPGFLALFPSVGAAMILADGVPGRPTVIGRVLGHPALVWVGNHSYSWYLWHWPVFMLGFAWGMQSHVGDTAGLAALALLLAMLSYRWVELPFWKGQFSHAPVTRVFSLSLLAILIVIAISLNYFRSLDPDKPVANVPTYDASQDFPAIYAQRCDSSFKNSDVHPCVIGEQKAPKTVVLIGDSIGAQWVSILPEIFRVPEWRTVLLTKSSCPMVDEEIFFERTGQTFTICAEWRIKILDYLSSLKPDVIIIGSAATYDFTRAQWVEGSSRVLGRLTSIAPHVVVIAGTPKLSFDGPGCLKRHARSMVNFSRADATNCRETLTTPQVNNVARYLNEAVQRFANARLLNLNDLVCPDRVCSAKNPDGQVVFRDSQHLTDSFVRAARPELVERFRNLKLIEPSRHQASQPTATAPIAGRYQ